MLNKIIFLENFSINFKQFNKNFKKAKEAFKKLKSDLGNFEIPVLDSYGKNYEQSFSKTTIKKFSKYKNIVIVGMGGSILGTKTIYSFFKSRIKKNIFFFDDLDHNLHFKFKKYKFFKNSCFVIISKSGNTLETITNLSILFNKNFLKNRLVIITEIKDSSLMNLANKFNADIIEHKDFIGGRYSVMSEVSMFPAALMGLSIDKFKVLEKLIKNKNFVSILIKNVASIYSLNKKGLKNSVFLNYESNLNDLCYWYQQLVGESLGKQGKGITPIISFCPKDHHSILQLYLDGPKDKFFTFLNSKIIKNNYKISKIIAQNDLKFLKNKNLKVVSNAQFNATQKIFKLKKIPYRKIILQKNNEEELGMIFTFFVLETILLAYLLKVNPFDQPAVEQVKIETSKLLA